MSGDIVLGTVKREIDWELEEQAHALLIKDRKQRGIKSIQATTSEEYCWLTDWQLDLRLEREVYNKNGVPDANIIEGRFIRAFNPLFGKRPKRSDAPDW
jgi:hypothetical protein